jgi:photosystem II stability/assembly factor-like uncharacterized protein
MFVFALLLGLLVSLTPSAKSNTGGCWLRDAASISEQTVLLLCEQGFLLKSRDLVHWETIRIPGASRLRALRFADLNHGYLVGDSGLILVTSDGGKTWSQRTVGTHEHLTCIYVADKRVWIAGYGGIVVYSRDGGATWHVVRTFSSTFIESLYFIDHNRGWAVGWAGLLLRTNDGGQTWQQVKIPGVWETLSCVYFQGERDGWAVGMSGIILRTHDGGASWQRQRSPLLSWFTSLTFAPDGTAWIAAEYNLLRSEDGGNSWQAVQLDTSATVTRVIALPEALLAVGADFVLASSHPPGEWRRQEVDSILEAATQSTGQHSARVKEAKALMS